MLVLDCYHRQGKLHGWDRTFINDLYSRQTLRLSPSQWEQVFRIWVNVMGLVKFAPSPQPEQQTPQDWGKWVEYIQYHMKRDNTVDRLDVSTFTVEEQAALDEWVKQEFPSYSALKERIWQLRRDKERAEQFVRWRDVKISYDDVWEDKRPQMGRAQQKGPVKNPRF